MGGADSVEHNGDGSTTPSVPPGVRARGLRRMGAAYGVALGGVVVATIARDLLDPVLAGRLPFMGYMPIVLAAAWLGGWTPALLGLVVSLAVGVYYFVPPTHSFMISNSADLLVTATYAVVGVLLAMMSVKARRTVVSSQNSAAESDRHAARLEAEVTERKRAQAAQSKTASLYRSLFECAGDAAIVVDPRDLIVLEVNERACTLYGLSRKRLLGSSLRDYCPTTRHSLEPLRSLAGRGQTLEFELQQKRPDNGGMTLACTASGVEFDGRPAILVVQRDVTAKIEAQLQLQRREDEIRLITDSVPVLISYVGADERYRFVNKQYESWFGHTAASLVGRSLRDVMGESTYAALKDRINAALSGREVRFEECLPDASGGPRWVMAAYIPHVDAQGAVKGFFALVNDISERKRAEEGLRISEQRFRDLANAMPQVVWTASPDGHIEYANQRFASCTGVTFVPGDALKSLVCCMAADDAPGYAAAWNAAVTGGNTFLSEFRVRTDDGATRWYLARAEPVRDDAGAVVRWYGTWTDIDDAKKSQERLRTFVAELNRSNRDLEEYAHVIAHDLKEPLRGVRTTLAFALEDSTNGGANAEQVKVAARLAERMDSLITSLLEYSQLSNVALTPAPTDLNQVVSEVLSTATPGAPAPVRVRFNEDLPTVVCDRSRVADVFRHLIDNGVRYSDREDRSIEIGWRPPVKPGVWPVLYVRDNGIGIPASQQSSVFRIFRRLHPRDAYGAGTGSGLALVKRIVERHGGQVWIESNEGEGTTVCFTIGGDGHVRHEVHPAH
jgi:PAS domain S-box-containing protein